MSGQSTSRGTGGFAPQQARSQATRRKLIAVAGQRFAAQGFHGTALAEVLADGEVTKGGFYFHFTSKEMLADAVVRTMVRSWEPVEPAVRRTAVDGLEALVLLTDAAIVGLDDPIVCGGLRVLRDRAVASPTMTEITSLWTGQAEGLLGDAAATGLLEVTIDPGWVARVVVASLTGRSMVAESGSAGQSRWGLMDEFWVGMLPLIATAGWSTRWEQRSWRRRRRPVGVGPCEPEPLTIHGIAWSSAG